MIIDGFQEMSRGARPSGRVFLKSPIDSSFRPELSLIPDPSPAGRKECWPVDTPSPHGGKELEDEGESRRMRTN